MKIRNGFVTNSSSSSYVVSYKVKFEDIGKLVVETKDLFGTRGLTKIFSRISVDSDHLIFEDMDCELEDIFDAIDSDLFDRERG